MPVHRSALNYPTLEPAPAPPSAPGRQIPTLEAVRAPLPASQAVRVTDAAMTEVIGTSAHGFDDAVREGMRRAATLLPRAAEAIVRDFRVGMLAHDVLEYRVTLMVPIAISGAAAT